MLPYFDTFIMIVGLGVGCAVVLYATGIAERVGLYVEYALFVVTRQVQKVKESTPSGAGEGLPLKLPSFSGLTEKLRESTGRMLGERLGSDLTIKVRGIRHTAREEDEDVEKIKRIVLGTEEEWETDRTAEEINERLRRLRTERANVLETMIETVQSFSPTLGNRLATLAPDRETLRKAGLSVSPAAFATFMAMSGLVLSILMTILAVASPLPTPAKVLGPIVVLLLGMIVPRIMVTILIRRRESEIARQLPYAIRQMATEVSAGLSLIESMKSISESDYGALSEEFERVVREINSGTPINVALQRMANRWDVDGLKTMVRFIVQAMESGANIAKTLMTLADEIAHELRQRYREYGHKLQALSFPYIMLTLVIPTLVTVAMLLAANLSGAFVVPPRLFGPMIAGMVGVMAGMFLFLFKSAEPKV
ncbi:type II secretion system F family protein [Methanopyrus sp. SNP6]|uniref:type II secretion system F family protein n=1 Tax=Methanopyrus sp. SNP6 TaxID=1937005 RepID=UPI0011E5E1A2|nr:type II secretion system F family protein [Methanopyrus sp. SNP6]